MRLHVLAPTAFVLLVSATSAWAGGRSASETCLAAGYHMGGPGFDACLAQANGADPLAALQGGELSAHGDGKARRGGDPLSGIMPTKTDIMGAPLRLPAQREELPASFNAAPYWGSAPSVPSAPTPSPSPFPPPSNNWPTPPTAPTLPTPPTLPWGMGGQ
ncbi:MAG TPA: hypothetical protein VL974_04740 [Magnetospirillum sp.]|jgi:hypothetical protein|nr:hypothetical protein [Magnetospirillum sp.]